MKALVSYYSRTGTMDEVCEMIKTGLAKASVDVDVVAVKRKTDVSYMYCGFEAVTGKKPEILGDPVDLSPYDVVFVGFPVWAGKPAPPIQTFMEDYAKNVKGKKFVTLAVSASKTHAGKSLPLAETMVSGVGGTVIASMPFCQRAKEENAEKAGQIVAESLKNL